MSARVLLQTFRSISSALAAAGVPPVSRYWDREAERFYTHPSARLLVECVGRGGDKSRVSTIMAIAEVLAGDFVIPPGERHYFTHVSENLGEASKTLGVLESYLRILDIPFSRRAETIELTDSPRGFKVLAARVGAVSGWRCIGWTADEAAKWDDEGTDPSAEIIASIRAMTVTHPGARGRLFSSPVSTSGYFFEAWQAGDSDIQITGHAPSWIANPSITEARTRELEPHEPTWRREYGAAASSGSSDALPEEDARAMVRALPPGTMPLGLPVALIDSSSGRGDGWSFAFARYVRAGDQRVLAIDGIGAFEGRFGAEMSFDSVVAHIAGLARRRGVARVFGDQYLAFAIASEFAKYGILYCERPWSQPSKIESLSTLRRLARERSLVVEPGAEAESLRKELVSLREVLLPSKVFTVQARRTGRGHADRASLLLLAARCIAEGDIFGTMPSTAGVASSASRPRVLRSGFIDFRGSGAPRPFAPAHTVVAPASGPHSTPTTHTFTVPTSFGPFPTR